WRSALYSIATLPVLTLGGRDGQPHLLADRARQKTANAVRLPGRSFHQFLQRGSVRPFQQVQDLGGLAAVAGTAALFWGLGRFLSPAGLLARLLLRRRNAGALSPNTGR